VFHGFFFRPPLKIQAFGHWGAHKFDDPFFMPYGIRKGREGRR